MIPRKHHLQDIQLIVEKAFADISWYGCNMRTMVVIKSIIIRIARKAFWHGYQEAMRDMSKNESTRKSNIYEKERH